MSKGGSGYFGGTKGSNKVFSDYPKTVHKGRQDKHIVGSNNYTSGRSVFSGTKGSNISSLHNSGRLVNTDTSTSG